MIFGCGSADGPLFGGGVGGGVALEVVGEAGGHPEFEWVGVGDDEGFAVGEVFEEGCSFFGAEDDEGLREGVGHGAGGAAHGGEQGAASGAAGVRVYDSSEALSGDGDGFLVEIGDGERGVWGEVEGAERVGV